MSQNYDDIQAQLAAYIDGALPPEQRAEIEKHLAANPSHQVLLGELTAHKRVIASLPRVKAPADLSEELLTQLEREQLLSEPVLAEHRPVIYRLFSGVGLAAAASVVLMIGLVAAVYHVLPGRSRVAIVSPSPEDTGLPKAAPESKLDAGGALARRKSTSAEDYALPAPVTMKPTAKDAEVFARVNEAEKPALTPSAQNVEQVTLAVSVPNVDQANGEVLRFLADNDIAWAVSAESEAQNARYLNYPRVSALSTSARIEQYSRAVAEELRAPSQVAPARAGGAAGAGGGGGGVGGGQSARDGVVTSGPVAAKAPARPTPSAPGESAIPQLAPTEPTVLNSTRELRSFGARPVQIDAIEDEKASQQKGLGTTLDTARLTSYTNRFAETDNRTILARGLKASQIAQLTQVLERPTEGQLPVVLRKSADTAATSAPRGRSPRDVSDLLAERAMDVRQPLDEMAKSGLIKLKAAPTGDAVTAKQESTDPEATHPAAKPGADRAIAPTSQAASFAAIDGVDRPGQLQQQPSHADDKIAGAPADQPATRPADNDLYDVLIVLSPAPVVPPTVNTPPASAAAPIPATAPVPAATPASRPMPAKKRE